jgi:hypothetical protein
MIQVNPQSVKHQFLCISVWSPETVAYQAKVCTIQNMW